MSYPREDQVEEFVRFIQEEVINPHYAERFENLVPPTIMADPGRRYVRIVRQEGVDQRGETRRSVFCFIDTETGDILKAEGWKKPAKHARGSLDDRASWAGAVTPHGAVYLL